MDETALRYSRAFYHGDKVVTNVNAYGTSQKSLADGNISQTTYDFRIVRKVRDYCNSGKVVFLTNP